MITDFEAKIRYFSDLEGNVDNEFEELIKNKAIKSIQLLTYPIL